MIRIYMCTITSQSKYSPYRERFLKRKYQNQNQDHTYQSFQQIKKGLELIYQKKNDYYQQGNG